MARPLRIRRPKTTSATSREVTLYTRTGCHLCEEAKAAMAPLLREYRVSLREINVDEHPVLKERYGSDVPLIFLGERKIAKHRVDVQQMRWQLADEFSSPTLRDENAH